MVPGESLRSEIDKQGDAHQHRKQVSGYVRNTHTTQGVLLLRLPHHAMHGDVIHDVDPVHPTPREWREDGGGRDHSAVTHGLLFVGFHAHS